MAGLCLDCRRDFSVCVCYRKSTPSPQTGNVPLRTPAQIRDASDAQLVMKITEEASEVAQAAAKHAQYGPRPFAGGVQYDNVADLVAEFSQLEALVNEYVRRFG